MDPKRWVLLEHSGFPDDSQDVHFDLLLEDDKGCRSWRLEKIPIIDGPSQKVLLLPMHKLDWLETMGREVSGGRGWARRLWAGFFLGSLPKDCRAPIQLKLESKEMDGWLEIKDFRCKLHSCSGSFFE